MESFIFIDDEYEKMLRHASIEEIPCFYERVGWG